MQIKSTIDKPTLSAKAVAMLPLRAVSPSWRGVPLRIM